MANEELDGKAMEIISDFHLHSRYAMACSPSTTIQGLALEAKEKGIKLLSTGDFTHPAWFNEIKENLVEHKEGIYKLKNSKLPTLFVLGVEVCTIFNKEGKTRKIHNCILAPSISAAQQVNDVLSKRGPLDSDGRPVFNMQASELVEMLMEIDKSIVVFPAHIWTPYFGALGSMSGFDSIKDAYEDQAHNIHALETGLSSDPIMNWRLSELDNITLLSNSDAHSLHKLGREANVLDIPEDKLSFKEISNAIIKKDPEKIKLTIEFYPEEGKYHFDGHRRCGISLSPKEAKKYNNICPVCRKKLTIGVLHRVNELADRPEGYKPKNAIPYLHTIPLREVVAYMMNKNESSTAVDETLKKLVSSFGSEFNVLLNEDISELEEIDRDLGVAINRIRKERVHLIPGYDGVFGVIDIMDRIKEEKKGTQRTL